MRKIKPLYLLAVLVLVNIAAMLSFSSLSFANTTDGTPCYQTMGYCGMWNMNYKCVKTSTSERCRLYACEDCGLSDSEEEENP